MAAITHHIHLILFSLDVLSHIDQAVHESSISFDELEALVEFYDIPCFYTNLTVPHPLQSIHAFSHTFSIHMIAARP